MEARRVSSAMPFSVPSLAMTSLVGMSVTSESPNTKTKAVSCSGSAGFSGAAAAGAGFALAAATSTGWRGLVCSGALIVAALVQHGWSASAWLESSSSGRKLCICVPSSGGASAALGCATL